jgi:hypothetical protein
MLSSLSPAIKKRRQQHQPTFYRSLLESGRLEQAIEDAENRAYDVETASLHRGLHPD